MASGGGVTAVTPTVAAFSRCHVSSNHVAGAGVAYGGGMLVTVRPSTTASIRNLAVRNNTVRANSSSASSAAGGGLMLDGKGPLTLTRAVVSGNTALLHSGGHAAHRGPVAAGGGVYSSSANASLSDCNVTDNR